MESPLYSRRQFTKTMAMGTAAACFLGCNDKYIAPIGVQLYSVRDALKNDFEGSIAKIAEMGFKGVETFQFNYEIGFERAAQIIKQNGLEVFACHAGLPVGDNRQRAMDMVSLFGAKKMIFPGWSAGEKFNNQEELNQIVETYNTIAADLKTHGMQFGLHNHWYEFENSPAGVIPFYYLKDNLDKNIFFEIDTYWAKTGGADPAKVLKDFGQRAPLLHIKDGIAKKGALQGKHVPAGNGNMDFKAIAEAGGRNIEWMVVEFDNSEMEIFSALQKSYTYLTDNKLALGKV